MQQVGIFIQLIVAFFILAIGSYDWFYANRIHSVERQLKIVLPNHLSYLLSVTKTISFGAAGIMILLILLSQHFFIQ